MQKLTIKMTHFAVIGFLMISPLMAKEDKTEDIERIVVTAQSSDEAMRAFNAGDFALAEIKFKENERCAFRRERNNDAFINSAQTASVNAQVRQGNTVTEQNSYSGEGGRAPSSVPKKSRKSKSSCDNRAFQFYMTGLSQIQLGRITDAEQSFERAIALNKNQYDAHHRLALMKLLKKDTKGAESHLSAIKSMLKRCYDCDARSEIETRIAFIQKALDGEIKLD